MGEIDVGVRIDVWIGVGIDFRVGVKVVVVAIIIINNNFLFRLINRSFFKMTTITDTTSIHTSINVTFTRTTTIAAVMYNDNTIIVHQLIIQFILNITIIIITIRRNYNPFVTITALIIW